MTYSTVYGLLNNAEIRAISPTIKDAYDSVEASNNEQGCSACAKRKRTSDAVNNLIAHLQNVSELELDRIKKILGVDKLVFPAGLNFIEK